MIKVILFDCDGPIIKREKYFSQRIKELLGIYIDEAGEKEFFQGIFLRCEVGHADLKAVLPNYLSIWRWEKSVDELLKFWFEGERTIDTDMIEYIRILRSRGIRCYLSTNNEKYRTQYLWEEVGLKKELDGLFSSCYLGYMKPESQYWQEIYKQFPQIPKNQILVLDDKQSAVDSAKNFGFQAEFYKNFSGFKKSMKKYRVKF